jgi:hypothetical protein
VRLLDSKWMVGTRGRSSGMQEEADGMALQSSSSLQQRGPTAGGWTRFSRRSQALRTLLRPQVWRLRTPDPHCK